MTQPTTPRVALAPRLPALSLREARPYLLAPFAVAVIGIFLADVRERDTVVRVVFYVPVGQVRSRLSLVAGANGWTLGDPAVLDTRSLTCSLSMFGARHVAVGEGDDRLGQIANGTKQCALLYGVGEFLDAIEPLEFEVGDGPEQVKLIDGKPQLTDVLRERARAHYASELERIGPRYGPALELSRKPWNAPVVPLGRARGLAALAVSVLERAERAEEVPAPLRSALEGLVARAPGGLAARISARRGQPIGAADAGAADTADGGGELIEIDFATLGPEQRRWAA